MIIVAHILQFDSKPREGSQWPGGTHSSLITRGTDTLNFVGLGICRGIQIQQHKYYKVFSTKQKKVCIMSTTEVFRLTYFCLWKCQPCLLCEGGNHQNKNNILHNVCSFSIKFNYLIILCCVVCSKIFLDIFQRMNKVKRHWKTGDMNAN